MIDFSFSIYDLEYFLLIFVRVSCFVYIAPYFGMNDTPARIRIGISAFTAILLYETLTPVDAVVFDTVMEYAVIVMKEAIAGLLIGFGANICMAIVNFAGSIADMETGLSMATLMDPATRESTSITGVLYQYSFMLMLIASGMYRYLFGALADSFVLIPVNGVVFHADSLLQSMIEFMNDYIMIGFRIVLPIFCATLLLNAILGVLAKVSPQMNMFAVGIQLKVLTGLAAMFLTAGMLPGAADFVYQDSQLGWWHIGLGVFNVGAAYIHNRDVLSVAGPFMRRLMLLSGETVNVAIRNGNEAVLIGQLECKSMVGMCAPLGSRLPLHASGAGKALLYPLAEEELMSIILQTGLQQFTPTTLVDMPTLLKDLEQARELGYTVDKEEHVVGLNCIASAIYDDVGSVVAAISISGPSSRLTEDRFVSQGELVRDTARDISTALGLKAHP